MAAEHARLDELLAKAMASDGERRARFYWSFREGLLRHIGIEEKILFPAARRLSGLALPLAERLKLDHGALAALMMLPPRTSTFRAVRALLDAHNPIEEVVGGVYEQCEKVAAQNLDRLFEQCVTAAAVAVSPWVDSVKVLAAARRALSRAGYDSSLLDQDFEVDK
jgi:hypothetical protein